MNVQWRASKFFLVHMIICHDSWTEFFGSELMALYYLQDNEYFNRDQACEDEASEDRVVGLSGTLTDRNDPHGKHQSLSHDRETRSNCNGWMSPNILVSYPDGLRS